MKEKKLVSFIIPVYNGEKYIERCLDSICQQTYTNIEVIVVDDGSIDNSFKIIKRYALLDSRIRCFSKENTGVSSTRNFALQQARGKYVFFVDADDWIESQLVEKNMKIMEQEEVDIVINDFFYNRLNNITKSQTFTLNRGYIKVDVIRKTLITTDNLNSQCISLYSMDIIREHKLLFPNDMKCGEDNIFNLLYANHIKHGFYTGEAYYHYEIHKGSGCRHLHNDQLEMYDKQFKFKQKCANMWEFIDSTEIKGLVQLIGTNFSAYAVLAQKEKNFGEYRKWLKKLYKTEAYNYLIKNKEYLAYKKIPRTYKILVNMLIYHLELLSYVYCAAVNFKLG